MGNFKMNGFPSHYTGVQSKSKVTFNDNPIKSQANTQALSYGMQGAQMGMAFGPWGAAIGGVGGAAFGYIDGKNKDDELARQNKEAKENKITADTKKMFKNMKAGSSNEGTQDLSSVTNTNTTPDTETPVESNPAKLEALYSPAPISKRSILKKIIEDNKKLKTIKK